LRFGFHASVLVFKNVYAEATFIHAYQSSGTDQSNHDNGTDYGYGVNGVSPYSKLSFGVAYYFTSTESEEMFDLPLKTERRIEYHTKLPAKEVRKTGVRLGWGNTSYYIKPQGNFEFNGYLTDDPQKSPVKLTGDDHGTNVGLTELYIGISRLSIQDLIVDVDGFGKKSFDMNSDMYIDFLYSPNHTLDNIFMPIYNGNKNVSKTIVVNDNTSFQNWGLRWGWMYYSNRGIGGRSGFELGIQPGVKNGNGASPFSNIYFGVKFGINFSQRLNN